MLVGFNYGGYVISGVADALPERIARPVYLDGFLPQAGKCFFDMLPPPARAAMENAAVNYGNGWQIPPAPVEMVGGVGALELGVDRAHMDAVLARHGPHPVGTYRTVIPHRSAAPQTSRDSFSAAPANQPTTRSSRSPPDCVPPGG